MQSADPLFPLFPIFSFLGFVLGLVPFAWHLQAWNAGTCAYMLWASLACLVEFINCMIWTGNAINRAPVWCDISSKFVLGAGVGIPAATLCIIRRLHNIATIQTVSITRQDKRRAIYIDLAIAVGIPVLVMALHYIVQPHRFDILEDIGCYASIYNTIPAYFLVFMWPVVLGVISFVYSALTLRAFWQRRIQFSELVSSNTSLNVSRYLRLMLLAITDMMFTIPLGVYSIYLGTRGVGLAPWISWEDTHYNFSRVQLVPALIWRSNPDVRNSVELTRWLFPISVFVFFGLFGFASEAQKHYRFVFWWVAKPLGFKPSTAKPSAGTLPSWRKAPETKVNPDSVGSLPIYVATTPTLTVHRRDSFSSYGGTEVGFDIENQKSPRSSPVSSVPPYSYPPSSAASNSTPAVHTQAPPFVESKMAPPGGHSERDLIAHAC